MALALAYLFIIIALPVMNSILMTNGAWAALLLANTAVVTTLFVLERGWGFHYELSQRVTYERIELIKPEHYGLLLHDLRIRTGLPVKRCEVSDINFLRDTAEIRIYYDDPTKTGSEFSWLENELEMVDRNGRFADEHL